MTITEIIVLGVALVSLAGAGFAALRYAKRLGRAEAEKEHADAILAAKERAGKVKRVTRSTVVDRLRDGSA